MRYHEAQRNEGINWGPKTAGKVPVSLTEQQMDTGISGVNYMVRAWTRIPERSPRIQVLSSKEVVLSWSRFGFSSVVECFLSFCGTLSSIPPPSWITKTNNQKYLKRLAMKIAMWFNSQIIWDETVTGVHGEFEPFKVWSFSFSSIIQVVTLILQRGW